MATACSRSSALRKKARRSRRRAWRCRSAAPPRGKCGRIASAKRRSGRSAPGAIAGRASAGMRCSGRRRPPARARPAAPRQGVEPEAAARRLVENRGKAPHVPTPSRTARDRLAADDRQGRTAAPARRTGRYRLQSQPRAGCACSITCSAGVLPAGGASAAGAVRCRPVARVETARRRSPAAPRLRAAGAAPRRAPRAARRCRAPRRAAPPGGAPSPAPATARRSPRAACRSRSRANPIATAGRAPGSRGYRSRPGRHCSRDSGQARSSTRPSISSRASTVCRGGRARRRPRTRPGPSWRSIMPPGQHRVAGAPRTRRRIRRGGSPGICSETISPRVVDEAAPLARSTTIASAVRAALAP